MPVAVPSARRSLVIAFVTSVLLAPVLPASIAAGAPDHLVISEVATGGASASDELIELHNPTAAALPLEGLELVYVTASGATVSKRAAWEVGAPSVPSGGHVLVANEAGIFASIADATFASGMAATGGSVALRIQGAATAIDAVGWGTATSSWMEGSPAPAPAAGGSLERLPGGMAGSGQDSDDNAADFVLRELPDPQNLGSPPTGGGVVLPPPDPTPVPPPPDPTPEPPTPEPPSVLSIAAARSLPDGSIATIEGVALTASDFHDGGGFVADASGGIAVIVDGGTFARGDSLILTGELDDRFSQRTLRVDAAEVSAGGVPTGHEPLTTPTGSVNEAVEGRLVRIGGRVLGAPTSLTTGLAYDLDDGSGSVRVLVGFTTGIDTAPWVRDSQVELVGVVGQRDSSGTGTAGYRVMPRDSADVLATSPPQPDPTPQPTPGSSEPAASSPPAGVVSIATARGAPKNARVRVRGVVTLPPGIADAQTAVIQDASGAIALRLGDEVGPLTRGELVQVDGTRSTKSGMETLRVTQPATRLGTAELPSPRAVRTGEAGEADEARLVVVRGALVTSARSSSTGTVYFDIDDGSGPLKISFGATVATDPEPVVAGTWVEVTGVLGQETTGALPERGYRVWPSSGAALRVIAAPGTSQTGSAAGGGSTTGQAVDGDLATLQAPDLAQLRIGATLVVGEWPELEIGGLLWDGSRLVAIDAGSADLVAEVLGPQPPPRAVELGGLRLVGTHDELDVPIVALSGDPGDILAADVPAAPPASLDAYVTGKVAWVGAVGRVAASGATRRLVASGRSVPLELRCAGEDLPKGGVVGLRGVAIGDPMQIVLPCGAVGRAPSVAAEGTLATIATPSNASTEAAAIDTPDPRRLLAGILLLVASAIVAGAAVWYRLAAWPRPPAAESDVADVSDDEEGNDPAAMPVDRPRLTLVTLPQEHGP